MNTNAEFATLRTQSYGMLAAKALICGLLFGMFLSLADVSTFVLVWVANGRPLLYPGIPAWTVLTDSAIAFMMPRVFLGMLLGVILFVVNLLRRRRIVFHRIAIVMLPVAVLAYTLVRTLHMGGPLERTYARTDIWNYTCVVLCIGLVVGTLTSAKLSSIASPPRDA